MDSKIKIYLADDHQVLIDGMLAVLKNKPNFDVVGYSLNGDKLIEKLFFKKVDILIMDINMPIKDGIQVLREMKEFGFPCKVIILSSYDEPKLIKEVLNLGASGYLTKECAGENIIDAIETVANGNQYFTEAIKEKFFNSFTQNEADTPKNMPTIKEQIDSITIRELEILKLISFEKSGKEISELLNISANTVETHRKNLMKKLHVKSSIGLVLFASQHNLLN
jgi:DNA-binding NarL/FixJ family response regulator